MVSVAWFKFVLGQSFTHEDTVGKAFVERHDIIECLDLRGREGDGQGLDILMKVFDLASSDYGEDSRCFMHDPSYSNYVERIKVYRLREQ